MTLNYQMIVERYLVQIEWFGGSIPECDIVSLLDGN